MNSQKLENSLSLALQTNENERKMSSDMNVGYDFETNRWELIVKYNGDLTFVESLGGTVEKLLAGYAIITISENQIARLLEYNEIEYVEQPKRLFYSLLNGKRVSCIFQVKAGDNGLNGTGVIIGILDSGERVIIMSS